MMKALLLKVFVFFLPVIVVIGIYIAKDPFKVLYSYESYYDKRGMMPVYLNRDHVSSEAFLQRHNTSHYDSYIFGSSRSENYLVADWLKHIHTGNCFHFSALQESIYGVERKVQLLKDCGAEMKHAIFAIDYLLLEVTDNSKERLYMKHRKLTGENWFTYQMKYFKDYFSMEFAPAYARYVFTGTMSDEVREAGVLHDIVVGYDANTNEIQYPVLDSLQKNAPEAYYATRLTSFTGTRPTMQEYGKPVITEKQKQLLYSIKKVLDEKKTDYVFIVNPLFDQKKMNPDDMATLNEIFGKENVYDFSGQNSITQDYHNFYDYNHFIHDVGTHILDSVYSHRAISKGQLP